jgi:adenylate cyclase
MNASIEPAAKQAAPRWRLGFALVLGLTLGGATFVSVGSVLLLGLIGAGQNTRALLRDKIELTVELIIERVRDEIDPLAAFVSRAASDIAEGKLDVRSARVLETFLAGAATASEQVVGVSYIRSDFRIFRYERESGRFEVEDWSRLPTVREVMVRAAREPDGIWVEPRWSPVLREPVLAIIKSVPGEAGPQGVIVTAIRLLDLSRRIAEQVRSDAEAVFVLYGEQNLLAHSRFATTMPASNQESPLLSIGEIESLDPVLAAYGRGEAQPYRLLDDVRAVRSLAVRVGGEEHTIILREIKMYGSEAWQIGMHLPSAIAVAEASRIQRMALVGAALMLLSIGAMLWLGHKFVGPLARLAATARKVRELEFADCEDLPASRVREVDEANSAFNSMVAALGRFATYIPKTLVRRMLAEGVTAGVSSRERDVTVMFTDIAGFFKLAAGQPAVEVANFLNRHFALLGGCIEASGGTVDKYIGDGLLAFWGAPERRPDHAERACRAARSIREALARENAERRSRGEEPIRVRIGIHSGGVIAGNIGWEGRMNYTLVGDTVNVAQRIEETARAFQNNELTTILVSEYTIAALLDRGAVRAAGRFELRGYPGPPIELYHLD